MNIFISYARENQDQAIHLYNDLKNQNHTPWLDVINLLPGQKWELEIKKALQSANYCIVLLSNQSVHKRGFVQKEQIMALDVLDQFPESDIFLMPARLDACDIPDRLSHLNTIDLFPNYEAGLDKILRALSAPQCASQFKQSSSDRQPHCIPLSTCIQIYVSYAVVDNQNQWVMTLMDQLQKQLKTRLGSDKWFSLAWDHHADSENPDLPDPITKQIQNAHIFIAIISPGYAQSQRCERECYTFLRESPGTKKHMLVIEREKLDSSSLPHDIQHSRPVRFWIQNQSQPYPKILGDPVCDPINELEYYNQVNALSYELKNLIQSISIHQQPITQEKSPDQFKPITQDGANDKPCVFLAEVTEDVLDQYDELRHYLLQAGCRVIPENPLTLDNSDACQHMLIDQIQSSCLYVQLLGHMAGKTRSNPLGMCRLQYDCAIHTKKHIIQWRDPQKIDTPASDADLNTLLDGESVMAIGFEEFKSHVLKRALFKPPLLSTLDSQDMPDMMVFIHAAPIDEDQAKPIEQLFKRLNLSVALPIWEGKDMDILNDLKDIILYSNGVMIVYGNIDTAWVRKQLMMSRNLIFRREHPGALAIYEGNPGTQPDFRMRMPNLHIINCRTGWDETQFYPFLEALKQQGGMI